MWPTTTPQSRVCQVHSMIAHTVARQVHMEWRQWTMLIHDALVWQMMHESARMLTIWENHKTLVWSKITLLTKFCGHTQNNNVIGQHRLANWMQHLKLSNGCNVEYLLCCTHGSYETVMCCILNVLHLMLRKFFQLVHSLLCRHFKLFRSSVCFLWGSIYLNFLSLLGPMATLALWLLDALDLHYRVQAYLLRIFVPLPTSLIKVDNSGWLHWALSLFIYFCTVPGLSHSCCRWSESKSIVRSKHSFDFVHWGFTRAHPLEPELSFAKKYFLQYNSCQIERFLKKWIIIDHWIKFPFDRQFPFKSNSNWCHLCSVTWITQQWMNSHDNFSFIVTWPKSQSKYNASQMKSTWKFPWRNPQTVTFSQWSVQSRLVYLFALQSFFIAVCHS